MFGFVFDLRWTIMIAETPSRAEVRHAWQCRRHPRNPELSHFLPITAALPCVCLEPLAKGMPLVINLCLRLFSPFEVVFHSRALLAGEHLRQNITARSG
jgi:hypothetical protein